MIEAQKKISEYCGTLTEKVMEAALTGGIAEKIKAIAGDAHERQLVVPVVGGFSAGKSSMINSLLGENILPVAITPETSLATELHYSSKSFIEAVKDNGEVDKYEVEEIVKVKDNAAKYKYARLYLNNSRLREIEPLVLVDMPGFDSPLEAHNKAIMEYLDRGCFYIVLSSVEEGTITKSLERRIREIEGYGREFAFFLSKANLRPKENVDELIAYFQNQINTNFECSTKVAPIENNSGDKVLQCLKNIDKNRVFSNIYKNGMLDVCDDIVTAINLQINASKKDANSIRAAIKEMEDSIEKLRKKAVSDQDDMRRRYSGSLINEVIADVGKALDNSLDELASLAASGNQEGIKNTLNDIVRSALSVAIKEKLEGINKEIVIDFSESIKGLDVVMKELNLDENYMKDMTGKIQSTLSMFTQPGGKAALNVGFKAVAGAGLAATVINPIIGIVVMLLPEIIGILTKLFGGGDSKDRQKEAIRTKFSGEIFPSIKRKLREEIPAHLDEQINLMIKTAGEQIEENIKKQSDVLNAQMAEKSTGIEEAEAKRQQLENVLDGVKTINSEILTWGK